ncbi:MAG: response regulator [Magnetococcales bacterium]|nr:response regulator [Magnetococcales bacterium]
MTIDDNKSVLIAEDDLDLLELLSESLKLDGWDVFSVTTGSHVLVHLIGKKIPDVILLDLNLEDYNGIEILKLIKEKELGSQVVIMTGEGTIQRAVEATSLGAIDFIEKPVTPDQILKAAENAYKHVDKNRPKNREIVTKPIEVDFRDFDGDFKVDKSDITEIQGDIVVSPQQTSRKVQNKRGRNDRRASDRRDSDRRSNERRDTKRREFEHLPFVATDISEPYNNPNFNYNKSNQQPLPNGFNNPRATPYSNIKKGSKTKKYIFYLAVGLTIVLGLYAANPLRAIRGYYIEKTMLEMEHEVKVSAEQLQKMLVRTDDLLRIESLASPALKNIMRISKNKNVAIIPGQSKNVLQDNVANIFSEHMRVNTGIYQQLRFLMDGREVVRVDFSSNNIETKNSLDLQFKGSEKYYSQALALGANEHYISPINLNRENGSIIFPYVPVVRFSKLVIDEYHDVLGNYHTVFGVLVANMFVQPVFEDLKRDNELLYISNSKDYYLLNPDMEKSYGFDLGHTNKMSRDFPEISAMLKDNKSYTGLTDHGVVSGRYVQMANNPSDRDLYILKIRSVNDILPFGLGMME